ncbi:MAG: glycoside hydrolase family 3 protein [Candidatus Marinimicrobia bacterium]|nr:glycoside hydrolase family 3 protein [Candidatus Neomarinimicrobiota bacterium]
MQKKICLLFFSLILSCSIQEYRDLNKNGKLDIYEDKNQSVENRVNDLISQMTIEEKAGSVFIDITKVTFEGSESKGFASFLPETVSSINQLKMNHFNIIDSYEPIKMLEWYNNIQMVAEKSRLGIPITIATDPRHGAPDENSPISVNTSSFSVWPSSLGMGAIGDENIVEEFGNIVRQEYKSIGINLALGPMADISTEPRWTRVDGTFGEDAYINAKLTAAYIKGLQGKLINQESVLAMVKHFPGSGSVENGNDSHFPPGNHVYPGDNFDYHLLPFEAAFDVGVSSVMPYYGIPVGISDKKMGASFDEYIINDLLRDKYNFDGIICSDWALITDRLLPNGKIFKPASAFGLEDKTTEERITKLMNAGIDMIGGESLANELADLIKSDIISEQRIDQSLRRIMKEKFNLGLFDNPYINVDSLNKLDNEYFVQKGIEAQKKSLVLLKNNNILPIKKEDKIFFDGFNNELVKNYNYSDKPENSDYILIKLSSPTGRFEAKYEMQKMLGGGPLDFIPDEIMRIKKLAKIKPIILVMSLKRPTIFTEIASVSDAIIADFQVQDNILLQMIFGEFSPTGKLPFELPSSTEAVKNQKEDLPFDSENPLFKFGHGLKYQE